MNTSTDAPIHKRALYRRPMFHGASVADPHWKVSRIRSSCGHALGLGFVAGRRQWALIWKRCR